MEGENKQGEAESSTTAASAPESTHQEDHRTLMGVLSYISVLVLIPYLMAKEDPFVFFHVKQGVILLIIEVALYALSELLWVLDGLMDVLNVAVIVLAVIGIVNVIQKKERELPFVGQFAKHFRI